MTPSTSIFETLTKYAQEYGVVSKQTESELAAINMALGASHVGARALVSTSGGGFALMAEALSLAGMTETPVVIAEVQRPGPSTGLPTRTEQGDLSFVVNVGHGEFPRLVLTPGTIEEYFQAGARAFNLAERYQTPVIVLADQHLADSLRPIPWEAIDVDNVEIDRGKRLSGEELDQLENYKRHELTEDGISPRALPGHPNAVFDTTGNEHDERGKITEDPQMREKMVEKRAQKLEQAGKEVFPLKRYGPGEAEVTFLGWGSSYGAIREATAELNEEGSSANFYHFSQVWPLPEEELKEVFAGSERTVMVEGNNESQLAHLIRSRLGEGPDASILRYDGRPLTPDYILSKLSGLNF
jgi:2-oxoglutarate ferredoxin oxidoreductase subunit alpha